MNATRGTNRIIDFLKLTWVKGAAAIVSTCSVIALILTFKDGFKELLVPTIRIVIEQSTVAIIGQVIVLLSVAAIVGSKWLPKSVALVRIVLVIFTVLGVILVMQPGVVPIEYVVVYDRGVEPFHPALLAEVEAQYVDDLEKLNMTGALENKVLISTVETPLLPKKAAFPVHLAMRRPIVSLQQAIGVHQAAVVDVSLSSFETDILRILRDRTQVPSTVNIYAEDGFSQEEGMLRNALRDASWTVRTTIYDPKSEFTADGKSAAIFLGSSQGLETFLGKTNISWKLLIVPNWVRPSLSRIAENTDKRKATRLCAASSVFDKLMVGDPATWATLFRAVDSCAKDEVTDFHTKVTVSVLQAFNRENETVSIPF